VSKPVGPQDYFDLLQKMANPAGYPFQSLIFPTPDPKEIEKKISELETVEHWLKTNLGLLQLSIKTLQYQKALLTPSEGKQTEPVKPDMPKPEEAMLNPAMWAWQLMNQAGEQMKAAAPKAGAPPAAQKPPARSRKR
jgi:hypothetical protein